MNWKNYTNCFLFILVLSLVAIKSLATPQEKDLLIYEGARYFSNSLPALTSVFPESSLPEFSSISTANWKGYRATWSIIRGQLYLVGVEGRIRKNNGNKLLNSQELFPKIDFPYKVNEFSGVIELDGRTFDFEIIDEDIVETLKLKIVIESGEVKNVAKTTINRNSISRNKGESLYESSSFRDSYEGEFAVSDIQAGEGKTYGVYFPEAEWRANLSPKFKCPKPAVVAAVFPINEKQEIDVSLEASEIKDTLLKVFDHPFMIKQFEAAGAAGIRLRITGDRLHWNTSELQKLHNTLKNRSVEPSEIRDWAYIIIDAKPRKYTSIYYNRKTGEIMLGEYSGDQFTPRLIGSIKD